MLHKHHIIPRHAGGTDDSTNLVYLSISEHAEAHRVLWEQHGRLEDKLAWLMLSGKTEDGERLRRQMASERMKQKWQDPLFRAKMAQTQQERWTPNSTHRARVTLSNTTRWNDSIFRVKTAQQMKKSSNHKLISESCKTAWVARRERMTHGT